MVSALGPGTVYLHTCNAWKLARGVRDALVLGGGAVQRELPAPPGRVAPLQPAFGPPPTAADGLGTRGPVGPGGWPMAYFLVD